MTGTGKTFDNQAYSLLGRIAVRLLRLQPHS